MDHIVLVTGATGFIGRYVARCYHAHGWYVIGIGHGSWGEAEQQSWGLDEWHFADVTFEGLSATRAERASVIVHCAGSGSIGFSVKHPEIDFFRNVCCTEHVLDFMRKCSPKAKLVFLSSAAVYGVTDSLPIKEDAVLRPISPYGTHKKIAEEMCRMYASQYGIASIIIRLFSVYGNGLRKQLLWDACNKFSKGRASFWGTGHETRDWVHVEDVAELLFVAHKYVDNPSRVVNCGCGENVSVRNLLLLLSKVFSYSGTIEFNGIEDNGNPKDYLADNQQILSWGWTPHISLLKGVQEYAEWFRMQT